MIFVTLGSQKFQFNRLLKKLDALIEENVITDEMFAQVGNSDYQPRNYPYQAFVNHDEFDALIRKCDLFITHGGTGAIIGAVKKGKKVIAVPRLARYGEHVDDHQMQLLKQFDGMGIIEACYDCERLGEAISIAKSSQYQPYQANTGKIIASIDKYIGNL